MAEPSLIKVCLTNKGEDTETPWASDLGPAGSDGSRKVKLVNVPFMHAKPTWGDTIIVKPVRGEGPPTWDRDGVPWKQIATKIVEDGGRWAMIIDYVPHGAADEGYKALATACDEAKIVCEGAWGPRDREPGRVYLAVQKDLTAEDVMGILERASLPVALTQIHPEPKKKTRAQTVVGISDDAGRPPAKPAKPAASDTPKAETSSTKKAKGDAKPAKTEASAATKPAKTDAVATKPPPVRSAPEPAAKPAPAKPAPAKAAPAKAAPAKPTPAKPTPAKAAPTKPAPAKPAKAAPTKPTKKK